MARRPGGGRAEAAENHLLRANRGEEVSDRQGEPVADQRVENAVRIAALGDEPGGAEHGEMPGDGRTDDILGAGGVAVGWRLAREFWGRGLPTEAAPAAVGFAFGELGFAEVHSITAVVNLPSRAVMERLGMTKVDEFLHPRVAPGSLLRPHARYRIQRG